MAIWDRLLLGYNLITSTLSEVDLDRIRSDSEQPFSILFYGARQLRVQIEDLLYADPYLADEWSGGVGSKYGPAEHDPIVAGRMPLEQSVEDLDLIGLVLLALDGTAPFPDAFLRLLDDLNQTPRPCLIVLFNNDQLPTTSQPPVLPPNTRVITLHNLDFSAALDRLAQTMLELLPERFHLAAARNLPGLRPVLANNLVHNTSLGNGTYALLSNLFQHVPVLRTVTAAIDTLILNKNQVILIYKLAILHGAPTDFRDRLVEIVAVISAGYAWREVGRRTARLVPAVEIVPKAALAYGVTYVVGIAAWRQYAFGKVIAPEQLKALFTQTTSNDSAAPAAPPAPQVAPPPAGQASDTPATQPPEPDAATGPTINLGLDPSPESP